MGVRHGENVTWHTPLSMLDSPRPLQPHLYDMAARVYLLMCCRNKSKAVVTQFITHLISFSLHWLCRQMYNRIGKIVEVKNYPFLPSFFTFTHKVQLLALQCNALCPSACWKLRQNFLNFYALIMRPSTTSASGYSSWWHLPMVIWTTSSQLWCLVSLLASIPWST